MKVKKKMIIFLKEVIYLKVDRKEHRHFKLLGEPLNNKSKFFD